MQVGDIVFAHDPETGLAGAREVTAIWSHEDTLVEFEVGDGTVTTTEDHEFWNVTDQAWQETQHIDAGDLLLTADGATVEAGTLLWDTSHVAPAFDLTINEIHTYHVTAGDQSVLVHNNTPTPCGSTNFPQSTFLSADEIATANRLIQMPEFNGIELRDFEHETGFNTFDYVDDRGNLYDQIGGEVSISNGWNDVLPDGRIRSDSFLESLERHFDREFNGRNGTVVVDMTGWADAPIADVTGWLAVNGDPARTIVLL